MEVFKVRNKEGLYWNGTRLIDFETGILGHYLECFGSVRDSFSLFEPKIPYRKNTKNYKWFKNNCEIVIFKLEEVETIKID